MKKIKTFAAGAALASALGFGIAAAPQTSASVSPAANGGTGTKCSAGISLRDPDSPSVQDSKLGLHLSFEVSLNASKRPQVRILTGNAIRFVNNHKEVDFEIGRIIWMDLYADSNPGEHHNATAVPIGKAKYLDAGTTILINVKADGTTAKPWHTTVGAFGGFRRWIEDYDDPDSGDIDSIPTINVVIYSGSTKAAIRDWVGISVQKYKGRVDCEHSHLQDLT